MNLIRIGKIVINFEHVTEILQGDLVGQHPESLTVNLVNGGQHTFTSDDAEGLRAFIDRTVKTVVKPMKDLEID